MNRFLHWDKCMCAQTTRMFTCHPPKAMPCCVTASKAGPSSAALHSKRCVLCVRCALLLAGAAGKKAGGPRLVRLHDCRRLLIASILIN